MTPHWLAYVPLCVLLVMVLGGLVGGAKLAVLLGKLIGRLENIEKQFKPNGGSSLKDDVNGLKGDIRDINTKFDAHLAQHSGAWR